MFSRQSFPLVRALTWLVLIGIIISGSWLVLQSWPRGTALDSALRPIAEGRRAEQAMVAKTILENYHETRQNASRWSGVYWGFTFAAAILSALAALVLKLESPLFKNEALKKDIAAVASVSAALLITLSTSGDFQRKWTANRIAAAELQRVGYEFLEKNGANARSYLARVGQILERRHFSIVGSSGQPQGEADAADTLQK
jgi:putative ribosome biogenesis GTPase RsgA